MYPRETTTGCEHAFAWDSSRGMKDCLVLCHCTVRGSLTLSDIRSVSSDRVLGPDGRTEKPSTLSTHPSAGRRPALYFTPMIDREIDRLIQVLARPGLSLAEAEAFIGAFDGREVAALPAVFRALHDAPNAAELNAAVQVLRRWSTLPLAAALPKALHALIREAGVNDLNKIAAAGLLMLLGEPVDDVELAQSLDDPGALAVASLADAVAASVSPAALVHFLDTLADWDDGRIIELCHDLVATRAPDAGRILGPLVCSPNRDVAIAALAAVERLAAGPARRSIAVAARAHSDEDVRRQAELTLGRLAAIAPGGGSGGESRTGGGASAGEAPVNGTRSGPRVWVSSEGERRAVVLAAAAGDDGASDIFTAVVSPDGIVSYAAAERVGSEGVEYVLAQLASGGLGVVDVEISAAEAVLSQATARTLVGGAVRSVGYAAWGAWLPCEPAG